MPATGVGRDLRLFLGPAHTQKGVPQAHLQEGRRGPRWQAKQWQR